MGCDEENDGLKQFVKNKYFYGKLMTVRDFDTEQKYFDRKRHLINRLIHGVGIVCGLDVSIIKDPMDGKIKANLNRGVALDCCGNEIVVEERCENWEIEGFFKNGQNNYLYIKYDKCETESVPVPADATTCKEVCCNNKVKECFKLVWGAKPSEPALTNDPKKIISGCPSCPTSESEPKVLLQVYNGMTPDETNTNKYRSLVYNNPLLYDIINDHIIHGVHGGSTAAPLTPGVLTDIQDVGSKNAGTTDCKKYACADHSHDLNTTLKGKIDSILPKSSATTSISKVGRTGEKAGAQGTYAPGDHVHQLNTDLINELTATYDHIRGKSLKNAVIVFIEAETKFSEVNMTSISQNFKDIYKILTSACNPATYDKVKFKNVFDSALKTKFTTLKSSIVAEKTQITEFYDLFINRLDSLINALPLTQDSDYFSLQIAEKLDEVSFYTSLLNIIKTVSPPENGNVTPGGTHIYCGHTLCADALYELSHKFGEDCTRCSQPEIKKREDIAQLVVEYIQKHSEAKPEDVKHYVVVDKKTPVSDDQWTAVMSGLTFIGAVKTTKVFVPLVKYG